MTAAEYRALLGCIGQDITDRVAIQGGSFGEDALLIDGEESGSG